MKTKKEIKKYILGELELLKTVQAKAIKQKAMISVVQYSSKESALRDILRFL